MSMNRRFSGSGPNYGSKLQVVSLVSLNMLLAIVLDSYAYEKA